MHTTSSKVQFLHFGGSLPFDLHFWSPFFCHISQNTIKRNILHPVLIDVGFHGATETLEMLIRIIFDNKATKRLASQIFLSFYFDGNYSFICLHQKINLLSRVFFTKIIDAQIVERSKLLKNIILRESTLQGRFSTLSAHYIVFSSYRFTLFWTNYRCKVTLF